MATINKETLIPVGLAASLLVAGIGFHLWLNEQLGEIKSSQMELKYAVTNTNTRIDNLQTNLLDRWTASHQKIWELEMRSRNPALSIPDTWDILNQRIRQNERGKEGK